VNVRVLLALAAPLLASCSLYFGDGSSQTPQDGGSVSPPPDSPYYPPPTCTPPTPLCYSGTICGNNQLDTCWLPLMPGGNHCSYYPTQEQCDGTLTKTCAELGFYGGTTTCLGCQSTDTSACSACGPDVIACDSFAAFSIDHGIAVSGSRVALLSDYDAAIFEGTTEIIRTQIPYPSGIVGVPGGWLVTMAWFPRTIAVLDSAGVLGQEIEIPEAAAYPLLASGPPGRVLLAWEQSDTTTTPAVWQVYTAILDTAGNTVVPGSFLFAVTGGSRVSVTSDGTSFFVGSNGKLARIGVDGASTIITGFPIAPNTTEDYVTITWGGTLGWYIDNSGSAVQRFDATGAKVGSVFAATAATTYVADGAELIALRRDPSATSKIQQLRIDATGAIAGTPKEVGVSNGFVEDLARLGSNIVVAWSRPGHLQVALVAP
jgi:hypothetical protein